MLLEGLIQEHNFAERRKTGKISKALGVQRLVDAASGTASIQGDRERACGIRFSGVATIMASLKKGMYANCHLAAGGGVLEKGTRAGEKRKKGKK